MKNYIDHFDQFHSCRGESEHETNNREASNRKTFVDRNESTECQAFNGIAPSANDCLCKRSGALYIPAGIHVDFVVRTCRKSGRLERVCRTSLNNRVEAGCTRAPMYTETVKRGN